MYILFTNKFQYSWNWTVTVHFCKVCFPGLIITIVKSRRRRRTESSAQTTRPPLSARANSNLWQTFKELTCASHFPHSICRRSRYLWITICVSMCYRNKDFIISNEGKWSITRGIFILYFWGCNCSFNRLFLREVNVFVIGYYFSITRTMLLRRKSWCNETRSVVIIPINK